MPSALTMPNPDWGPIPIEYRSVLPLGDHTITDPGTATVVAGPEATRPAEVSAIGWITMAPARL